MSNFAARHARTTLALLLLASIPLAAQDKQQDKQQQPLDINSFEAVKVVSDPQMAPNGSAVLYGVRTTSRSAPSADRRRLSPPRSC